MSKRSILFLSILIFVFPKKAYAYLDPGTSNYVLQVILAFLFGGILSVRIFWGKLKGLVNRIFRSKDA